MSPIGDLNETNELWEFNNLKNEIKSMASVRDDSQNTK
jgi:hypothetical protein